MQLDEILSFSQSIVKGWNSAEYWNQTRNVDLPQNPLERISIRDFISWNFPRLWKIRSHMHLQSPMSQAKPNIREILLWKKTFISDSIRFRPWVHPFVDVPVATAVVN